MLGVQGVNVLPVKSSIVLGGSEVALGGKSPAVTESKLPVGCESDSSSWTAATIGAMQKTVGFVAGAVLQEPLIAAALGIVGSATTAVAECDPATLAEKARLIANSTLSLLTIDPNCTQNAVYRDGACSPGACYTFLGVDKTKAEESITLGRYGRCFDECLDTDSSVGDGSDADAGVFSWFATHPEMSIMLAATAGVSTLYLVQKAYIFFSNSAQTNTGVEAQTELPQINTDEVV
jgi:hypothetical protein